ncbi:aminopeptidase P N-terminal domain-containing protein [Echinicola vietnamensis]|uniref:Xaa-Pro aminopeptidase n=1 Tax=Echinicola vietnamensis (strain DSM 17526 / LMG 23754 / KMM 6221) TaxID=926556 RepID=L0FWA8_ECHVK|nr:aminopeptidase P N-terminal domain-containing protein [Echinicola vietnamensis]AGA77577.1 Xaa-Pro aminopeptidase [Echinicola vietnamensis DSM 17526]
MKTPIFLLTFLFAVMAFSPSFSQSYFDDGLDQEFHRERRAALRELLPANSVAIIFTNPVKNRSNDVDFIYHPNTDFFYLTGYREPNAALVIFSEAQEIAGEMTDEIIYVQPRDENAEMWNGKRLGIAGVQDKLGFEAVYLNEDFGTNPTVKFDQFDKILTFSLSEDIEESSANKAMLEMREQFKTATAYPEEMSAVTSKIYELIRATDQENSANVAQVIGRYRKYYPEVENDEVLMEFANADTPEKRMAVAQKIPFQKLNIAALPEMMTKLRGVKTTEEIGMLKKAIRISAIGQIEVMKALKPGMSEREVQGIHEFVYKRYGAENIGYPSIVGAGKNGCILHYISNDLRDPDKRLMLMDLGAEWRGYTADVTRTIPISGTFTPEEKAIYDLVYKAQEAAMQACKPGVEFGEISQIAKRVINEGLEELGIIIRGQRHRYFPHGTSHHLGLDVHDRGAYGPLEKGMVLTVEPGIYIPEGSDCDPKWWNIAVRIEDDVVITENGFENLSADAPRTSKEVEAMMAQPSVLENWVLPEL